MQQLRRAGDGPGGTLGEPAQEGHEVADRARGRGGQVVGSRSSPLWAGAEPPGQPRPAPSPNRGHVPVGKQPGGVVAFGRQLDEPLETLLLDRGDLGGDDGAVTEEVVEELL